MKKSIPKVRERESEAAILGNDREREFPLTPATGCRGVKGRPTGSQGVKGKAYRVPGGQGVGLQGPRGSRGHLCDPFVPSGWFDETSDDS